LTIKNLKQLIIFTGYYPYGIEEESFLRPEIKILNNFFNIIIIPTKKIGKLSKIPAGVKVIDDYSNKFKLNNLTLIIQSVLLIISSHFWKEIINNPNFFFNIIELKELISNLVRRNQLFKWLEKNGKNFIKPDAILYTFWFGSLTSAILDYKKKHPNLKVITRAHGSDLYEEKVNIFFRKEAIKVIDGVFLISKNGFDYICKKYSLYKNKFYYSPLAIESKNIKSKKSPDNVFRIVSCSFIRPEKRLNFMANCIKELSFISKKKIEWFHIGGNVDLKAGDKLRSLKILTKHSQFNKINFFFLGNMPNTEVLNFYKNQPLDLFLLLSSREGKPVSIMEALSVGLPVISTNVGGVSELIDQNKNGILVQTKDSSKKVANTINALIKNPKLLKSMRRESIIKWKKVANHRVNFQEFAKKVNAC